MDIEIKESPLVMKGPATVVGEMLASMAALTRLDARIARELMRELGAVMANPELSPDAFDARVADVMQRAGIRAQLGVPGGPDLD